MENIPRTMHVWPIPCFSWSEGACGTAGLKCDRSQQGALCTCSKLQPVASGVSQCATYAHPSHLQTCITLSLYTPGAISQTMPLLSMMRLQLMNQQFTRPSNQNHKAHKPVRVWVTIRSQPASQSQGHQALKGLLGVHPLWISPLATT